MMKEAEFKVHVYNVYACYVTSWVLARSQRQTSASEHRAVFLW